jgi:hypothetical protein
VKGSETLHRSIVIINPSGELLIEKKNLHHLQCEYEFMGISTIEWDEKSDIVA